MYLYFFLFKTFFNLHSANYTNFKTQLTVINAHLESSPKNKNKGRGSPYITFQLKEYSKFEFKIRDPVYEFAKVRKIDRIRKDKPIQIGIYTKDLLQKLQGNKIPSFWDFNWETIEVFLFVYNDTMLLSIEDTKKGLIKAKKSSWLFFMIGLLFLAMAFLSQPKKDSKENKD